MKVLLACEESQATTIEFRNLGIDAYSCDILPCSGGHPEWHIQDDVLNIINDSWDLIIAHPPCTYLSNAGARWLYQNHILNEDRFKLGLAAKDFFLKIYNANCKHICIENPIPSSIYGLPKPTQIIQPYFFGDPFSKKTYLWLKGLPPLFYTNILYEYVPYVSSGSYSKYKLDKFKGVSRSGGAAKIRSKTFPGIAKAFAEQYSNYLMEVL